MKHNQFNRRNSGKICKLTSDANLNFVSDINLKTENDAINHLILHKLMYDVIKDEKIRKPD